jgi:hypothetical protein
MDNLPDKYEPKALDATIGVKFSNDIFLHESLLKQFNIAYNEKDLEDIGFGKGIVIKRE